MNPKILADRLVEATRDPADVAGWVNRMGLLVHRAGIATDDICWQGSPADVAFNIADALQRGPGFDSDECAKLLDLLQQ